MRSKKMKNRKKNPQKSQKPRQKRASPQKNLVSLESWIDWKIRKIL